MANLMGYNKIFSGTTDIVDTQKMHPLGTRSFDKGGSEYIYLAGVGSTVLGSWVTVDEARATLLATANAVGRVAIAMAAIDTTSKYGWYLIYGKHVRAKTKAGFADDGVCYLTSTAGSIDDADVGGDLILGAIGRSAGDQLASPSIASAAIVEISYPHVNDTSDS